MTNLLFGEGFYPLMAPEDGGEGGGAGSGNGEPGTGDGKPAETAAAALAKTGSGEPGTGNGKSADVDLAKTSDEDYAKLVMPDVEGEEVDRSLITPMAKELREAGIQPSVMAKVAAAYRRVVDAEVKKNEDERAARMKEMSEKCLREVSEDERRDFAAAYAEYIAKDEALNHLVLHTELGSSAAFIRLAALAGAALRVEKSPRASAAGGTSQRDTDRGVFEATVPAHLR